MKEREGISPGIGLGWGATKVSNFQFSPIEAFEPEILGNFQIWSVTFIFHCFSLLECLRCFLLFKVCFNTQTGHIWVSLPLGDFIF